MKLDPYLTPYTKWWKTYVIRAITRKLLQKSIGVDPHDLGFVRQWTLDIPPIAWATREKNGQIGFYKNGKLLWLKWHSQEV